MNCRNEEKCLMFKSVRQVFIDHPDIWLNNPAIADSLNLFDRKLRILVELPESLQSAPEEPAAIKSGIRETLIRKAFKLASSLMSYAAATENNELYMSCTWTETKLRRLKRDDFAPACYSVMGFANENLKDLSPYGITPAFLDEINRYLDQYKESIAQLLKEKEQKRILNGNIVMLVSEVLHILQRRIDHDMVSYRDTAPDFYREYRQARKIGSKQIPGVMISGNVTEWGSMNPLSNVKVRFESSGITVKTTVRGNFRIKNPPEGQALIRFSKKGYTDKTEQLMVPRNGRQYMAVRMERSGVLSS